MSVKMRLEALKKHDIVEVSQFTEMEVEHGHDTGSRINAKFGVHSNVRDNDEHSADLLN